MKTSTTALKIMVAALAVSYCSCQTCPKDCSCIATRVQCKELHLREIPKTINTSVTSLDLSENPELRIARSSFLKFHELKRLILNNCSIKVPFVLPSSLSEIHLERNKLNMSLIEKTFENSPKSLQIVNLKGNGINFAKGLHAIPKQVHELDLSENVIPIITPGFFQGFSNIRIISFRSSKLTRILPQAFIPLHNLTNLELHKNELKCLPPWLFETTRHLTRIKLNENKLSAIPDLRGIATLRQLDLADNRIQNITSRSFGIRWILQLILRGNLIENFELDDMKYMMLDLSHNRIIQLGNDAFKRRRAVTQILLHNNRIAKISPFAFRGMKWILELYLQNNRIRKIEPGAFRGLSINKLMLYGNNISSVNGVFDDMRVPPKLVLLFGNPPLTTLHGRNLKSLTRNSVVCIDCKNLKVMSEIHLIKAKIKCMPTEDLNIDTPSNILASDGFHCTYNSAVQQYQCYPCPIGYYGYCANGKMMCSGSCKACPPGSFFQDELATKHCKTCPTGQFVPPDRAPGKSPLDCLTCPKGTNTNAFAGYRACACLDGYARSYRFGECRKCTTVGFTCKRDYPQLKPGFWMTWLSRDECKESYKAFLQNLDTKNDTYSRKTMRLSCNIPNPNRCPIAGSCLGDVDANCSAGYAGVLCAVCDIGYSRQFNRCIKCPKPGMVVLQFIGYLALFIIVCILISWTDRISITSTDRQEGNEVARVVCRKRTFADAILSTLKILLGFYQVLDAIIHASSSINWPHSMRKAIGVFEYLQFNIVRIPSLGCIKPGLGMNAIGEFWFSIIVTMTFPIAILLYYAVASAVIHLRSPGRNQAEKCRKCWKNCLRAIALFMFATYPLTSGKIVKILPVSCHTFCIAREHVDAKTDGKCLQTVSYLRGDYSVKCLNTSTEHNTTLISAYVALVLPVGLPLVLWVLLRRFARRKIQNSDNSVANSVVINESLSEDSSENLASFPLFRAEDMCEEGAVQSALKFAYENYSPSCWYWEVIEMLRKLIMTVGVVLFLQHTKVGLGGIIIVAMAFTTLQAAKNPIKDRFENFLQLLSLLVIPINLSVGMVLRSNGITDREMIEEQEDSLALGIILVAVNSLLLVLVIGRFVRVIGKKICLLRDRLR